MFPEPRTCVQTSVSAPQRLKMRWRQVLTGLKHLATIYKKNPKPTALIPDLKIFSPLHVFTKENPCAHSYTEKV